MSWIFFLTPPGSRAQPSTNSVFDQAACQTCYGAKCYLDQSDCAGPGYGPTTPAVSGDAFFGYAAGCSGGAGRIWPHGNSFTTFGTWAP